MSILAALAVAVPLGLVAGVIAVLIEAGLLIDPLRDHAPTPNEHLKAFGLVGGASLPSVAITAIEASPLALASYIITSSGTFLIGMAAMAVIWFIHTGRR